MGRATCNYISDIFVPYIVPEFWRSLSKYLMELPSVYPQVTTLEFPPLLPIPITVLYLPTHQYSLKYSPRLDKPTFLPDMRWHQQQADKMCRLSTRTIQD